MSSFSMVGLSFSPKPAFITQPEMAKQLQQQKWQAIAEANPDVVVTANPGCLAWLTQAAEENKSPIPIIHIARFIAERCHNLQA